MSVDSSGNHLTEPLLSTNTGGHVRQRRLLDRDAAFGQSRGRWSIQPLAREATRISASHLGHPRLHHASKRFWDNWFYTLAYQRTIYLMMTLFGCYTTLVFLFACIYLVASRMGKAGTTPAPNLMSSADARCDMDINSFMEALYFSLSTQRSIGYGVSDYYLTGCWAPFLLVLSQVCTSITFDAVAIGLLFQRISRGHKRSKSILCSTVAVVQRVRGIPYLMFRVAELRSHQLVAATARSYCIRHERHLVDFSEREVKSELASGDDYHPTIETTHYVTKPMTLQHEDSSLLMSLPQVLVHRIDESSPLHPPPVWYDRNDQQNVFPGSCQTASQCDSNQKGHNDGFKDLSFRMRKFLLDRETELVVLIEGVDELTGTTIQTRHSYVSEDLEFDRTFEPCVFPIISSEEESDRSYLSQIIHVVRHSCTRRSLEPGCVIVDFAKFHETKTAPLDSRSCPYVTD